MDWSEKEFKAIWRGSSTGGDYTKPEANFEVFHRHKFIDLCGRIKDCDAGFTSYVQCSVYNCLKMKKRYGLASFIPMAEAVKAKIIVDIDGNTYSARFPTVLSS